MKKSDKINLEIIERLTEQGIYSRKITTIEDVRESSNLIEDYYVYEIPKRKDIEFVKKKGVTYIIINRISYEFKKPNAYVIGADNYYFSILYYRREKTNILQKFL